MPEIAEVARIVHFLRTRLVGHTFIAVDAKEDANIFGKVGTTAEEFKDALMGKRVVGAGQQGKYFWIEMESPPHPLFHFGMTGWLHLRNLHTYYYASDTTTTNPEDWPPKFTKFSFLTNGGGSGAPSPRLEGAFTDPRRFGRIRLLHTPSQNIRTTPPLSLNGPDPVIDKSLLTLQWLTTKISKRHIPIKALLLDQAVISGVGNWVGDEVLFQAGIHPETYADCLSAKQTKKLWECLLGVAGLAVELLGESERFPDNWLFRHRWGKGKGSNGRTGEGDVAGRLPTGEKIVWITVGGRTSAVVPERQRKGGESGGSSEDGDGDEEVEKVKKSGAKKGAKRKVETIEAEEVPVKKGKTKGPTKRKIMTDEEEEEEEEDPVASSIEKEIKTTKSTTKSTTVKAAPAPAPATANSKAKRVKVEEKVEKVEKVEKIVAEDGRRRRSGRLGN